MTIKIETIPGTGCTIIILIGEVEGNCLPELRAQIEAAAAQRVVLGMEEVTLVDLEAIRFLIDCQINGIELRGCSAYILEWIAREKEQEK